VFHPLFVFLTRILQNINQSTATTIHVIEHALTESFRKSVKSFTNSWSKSSSLAILLTTYSIDLEYFQKYVAGTLLLIRQQWIENQMVTPFETMGEMGGKTNSDEHCEDINQEPILMRDAMKHAILVVPLLAVCGFLSGMTSAATVWAPLKYSSVSQRKWNVDTLNNESVILETIDQVGVGPWVYFYTPTVVPMLGMLPFCFVITLRLSKKNTLYVIAGCVLGFTIIGASLYFNGAGIQTQAAGVVFGLISVVVIKCFMFSGFKTRCSTQLTKQWSIIASGFILAQALSHIPATDSWRLVLLLFFIFSILKEVTYTFSRTSAFLLATDSTIAFEVKRRGGRLRKSMTPFFHLWVQAYWALLKRTFMSNISNTTTLAMVLLTQGAEEIFFRTTMDWRQKKIDAFLEKYFGDKNNQQQNRKLNKFVQQAASSIFSGYQNTPSNQGEAISVHDFHCGFIVGEMICEYSAIVVISLALWLFGDMKMLLPLPFYMNLDMPFSQNSIRVSFITILELSLFVNSLQT